MESRGFMSFRQVSGMFMGVSEDFMGEFRGL